MANLPLVTDRIGLRLVVYDAVDPGYIDDVGRGAKNVNRTVKYGGRAIVRIAPGDGWTIDVGGVVQNIGIRDGQYAERGLPPLTRSTVLAQPFDNDYSLGHIVVRKTFGGVDLVSASAVVRHDVDTQFDATGAPGTSGPTRFDEHDAITLVSHETRLAGGIGTRGAWVGGFSILHDSQRLSRRLGDPQDPAPITGVRNDVTEAALFGQMEWPLAARLTATVGGRFTYAGASGEPLDVKAPEKSEAKRTETHFSPTLAIAWRATDRLSLFAHVQQGFRAGGLAVSQDGAMQSVQRFKADEMSAIEAGFRFGHRDRDVLWASATVSYAQWHNIQADLVDTRGLPFTANIGDGRIWGLEAQIGWRPAAALTLDGSLFLNDSGLHRPAPDFAASGEAELPNIARAGGRIGATWRTRLSDKVGLSLDAAAR
jgi:outer membrane receptor protein involved in Fe transport